MMLRTKLLLFSTTLLAAAAQDATSHSFRILPVGDPPPFIQEVKDGVRYEVAPKKGSLPPRALHVPCIDATKANENQSIQPRLGKISSPFLLPVLEQNKSFNIMCDDGNPWLKLDTRSGGDSLLLIWRGGKYWDQASFLEIPCERFSRQSCTIHFANLTNVPVAIVYGQERIRLNSGKFFSRTLEVNAPSQALEIFIPDREGKLNSIYANQVEPLTPSMRVFTVYSADGVRPRNPIKVLSAEEIY